MSNLISHAQALFRKNDGYVGKFDPTYEVITMENVSDGKRCLKQSVVTLRDNSVEMAKYDVADFYLENLAAVGALQDSKRITLNPSTMDMIDAVDNGFEILNDIYDYNNNTKNTDE